MLRPSMVVPKPNAPAVTLDVVVTPNASRTEVVAFDEGRHALRVRVAARPIGGAANDELIRFLADRLELPRSAVRIVAGHTRRRKTIAILGLESAAVQQHLHPGVP